MTPNLAFEGVLLSQNAQVLCTMNRVLDDFAIETNVCLRASEAAELLHSRKIDILVVDWDDTAAVQQVIESVKQSATPRVTVLALVANPDAVSRALVSGAQFVLQKPLSVEAGTKCMRAAYNNMVREKRQVARIAVNIPVILRTEEGDFVTATILDISEGGLGVHCKQLLPRGSTFSCGFLLPGTRILNARVKVTWNDKFGLSGGEFAYVPPADYAALRSWLTKKSVPKK